MGHPQMGGGGVKDFVTIVLNICTKRRDDGGRVSKIALICVTSFVDDPIHRKYIDILNYVGTL